MNQGPAASTAGVGLQSGESSYWHRLILTLGVLLLFSAGVKAIHTLVNTGVLLEASLDLLLIGAPGVVLLFVGTWLPTSAIEPAFYPRIVAWGLGGVVVMAIVLGLRVLHPGVTVSFAFGTQAVFLAIGSIAGLGMGVHEARALVHSRRLEDRNEALRRTERKLDDAVADLEASKADLEASKAAMEASNADLEASNEQLEQFAYAASHDLREPLRMVNSYLQLIDNRHGDDLGEDGREFLAFALDGAQRMGEMIDSLLEYSRVETQSEAFGAVDLDAVLDDVLADLQFSIEEHDATISREPLPTVEGDEEQLRQVFQNLLSNAIRYSDDDPPRIHVNVEHDGPMWQLQVCDDGPGIAPDDADRIFDVFQRLHSTEEQAGSGIGLSMCERIVERHEGQIWVDSELGEGATFCFTLPLRPASDEVYGPAAPLAESDGHVRAVDRPCARPPNDR